MHFHISDTKRDNRKSDIFRPWANLGLSEPRKQTDRPSGSSKSTVSNSKCAVSSQPSTVDLQSAFHPIFSSQQAPFMPQLPFQSVPTVPSPWGTVHQQMMGTGGPSHASISSHQMPSGSGLNGKVKKQRPKKFN